MILTYAMKLSSIFEFCYAAMIEPKGSVLFMKKSNKALRKMFRHYEYEQPDDFDLHLENTQKGLKDINYMLAVMSKGLAKKSLLKQTFRSIKFAIKYRKNDDDVSRQANFFMTVFKEQTIMRMLRIFDNDIVKSQTKKGLRKIDNDVKIYIPMNEKDVLTHENLDDENQPEMVAEMLDLPCSFKKKN